MLKPLDCCPRASLCMKVVAGFLSAATTESMKAVAGFLSAATIESLARHHVPAWPWLFLDLSENLCVPTCAGIIGYALVDCVKCPAPLAVLAGGVCGVIGWAAHMH